MKLSKQSLKKKILTSILATAVVGTYSTAFASEYTETITGANDGYSNSVKNISGDTYTYEFAKGDKIILDGGTNGAISIGSSVKKGTTFVIKNLNDIEWNNVTSGFGAICLSGTENVKIDKSNGGNITVIGKDGGTYKILSAVELYDYNKKGNNTIDIGDGNLIVTSHTNNQESSAKGLYIAAGTNTDKIIYGNGKMNIKAESDNGSAYSNGIFVQDGATGLFELGDIDINTNAISNSIDNETYVEAVGICLWNTDEAVKIDGNNISIKSVAQNKSNVVNEYDDPNATAVGIYLGYDTDNVVNLESLEIVSSSESNLKAESTGISIGTDNSKVEVSKTTNITTTTSGNGAGYSNGLAVDAGTLSLGKTEIHTQNNSSSGKSRGIATWGGEVNLADGSKITAEAEGSGAIELYGIVAENDSKITLGKTDIFVNNNTDNEQSSARGIDAQKGAVVNMAGGTIKGNAGNSKKEFMAIFSANDSNGGTGTEVNVNQGTENDVQIVGKVLVMDGATVNLNLNTKDSFVTGYLTDASNYADGRDEGNTINLTLANNAQWNTASEDNSVRNITLNDGIINLVDGATVNTKKLDGNNGIINTTNLDKQVFVENKNADTQITVHGDGNLADLINADNDNAQKLANTIVDKNNQDSSLANKVTTDEGDVAGAYDLLVKDGKVVMQAAAENSTNRAISDMASISLMTWRQENNDMNKRLGELRDSKGEHGAWARMARGESKYGAQNVKNQYNYYQVGYDEKLSVNPDWTVGVALTRTEGNSTFTNGSAENKHTGLAVYGSYLKDDGSFIDLIAKYARMKNEFTINGGAGNGDYETNGYSISAEYGKRFTKDNGFWIEPQVELTYGYVGAASFLSSNGANVRQDGMDSLVGRIGFSLGRDIKAGNVYARASYLYDFDGETDISFSKERTNSFKEDLGGSWWEVGVGTNINLSDATHLYFDVEKTYGGNVATPWQWNAGVRWSF